jgi:hypothetical protein
VDFDAWLVHISFLNAGDANWHSYKFTMDQQGTIGTEGSVTALWSADADSSVFATALVRRPEGARGLRAYRGGKEIVLPLKAC